MNQILFILLLTLYSCNSTNYTDKDLPQELQFDTRMREFHKRDFFKEIDSFTSTVKPCKDTSSCSKKEESDLEDKIRFNFIIKRNEMSWQCDHGVNVAIYNAKDNADIIKPLLKRMKFCDELNIKFENYIHDKCMTLLNNQHSICENMKAFNKDNARRKLMIQKLSAFD